ncbi:unnamed protein product [Calicophoron daubneyi]|uniref:Uncharacterized protein n=1 Tax=Calicophoron daubneyi TaxID=300641 RepID=A0AAV2T4G2_CALDB
MTSAFKSRTDRSGQKCGNLSLTFPGPGNYEVADSQDTLANSAWAGRSCFLSKSERPGLESKDKVPGPGTYEIKETSVNKRSSGKVKISKKINDFKPVANSFTPQMDPGPGAYNISSGFSAPHFMSSAAFLSNVPRWLPPNAPIGMGMGDMVSGGGPLACAGGADAFSNPGPTRYNPTLPTRMSYHYNTNNGWL